MWPTEAPAAPGARSPRERATASRVEVPWRVMPRDGEWMVSGKMGWLRYVKMVSHVDGYWLHVAGEMMLVYVMNRNDP